MYQIIEISEIVEISEKFEISEIFEIPEIKNKTIGPQYIFYRG